MASLDFHFVNRFRLQAKKWLNRTALHFREQAQWQEMSWQTFQQEIDRFSYALIAQHIDIQDKIGIFANNMPRWTIADFGAMQARAVAVPIYATNTAKQVEYIVNDADIKILFVGDQEQFDQVYQIANNCPQLMKIVAMKANMHLRDLPNACYWEDFLNVVPNEAEFEKRLNSKQLSDLFTLIYTSGTTGEPKGVMLDYANLAHQLNAHDLALNVNEDDVSLSFLPLSHIFERAWIAYVFHRGATNCYLEDTNHVRDALTTLKPTVMCAVPRFYEKIYTAVWDKVEKAPLHRRALFNWAIRIGEQHYQIEHPSPWLRLQYALADKLVLTKLRALLGGRIKMMPCGGAKMEASIGSFFHSIGINIKLGYGMTETTATVSCWQDKGFNPNSIGTLMPNAEVKIGEENEILVRGGMVMRGYYKKLEETAKAFTDDGFLRTGDVGEMDSCGNLFITDRLKELMKTSNGKYIAPQYIEGKIGKDKFIEQIAVIADAKKYVSALIVPCFDSLEEYAKQLNIKYQDRIELIKHSDIIQMFERRIHKLQKELPSFEQVKRFTLLPQAFSTAMEEITPTLKLRRKVIMQRYRVQIEEMYNERSLT
ncbi:long-chain fatty acid--CoA ligase [Glaesserella parasuis]|nr:long-chain fatty acid--CoA ligase [Glaesserella parasuis]MCT8746877.1 long-chain fatty acid--CoA ligase [Glaesserella parasuis]MCT8748677.1 long-chain fatty acid--CoA ligase [Glaesserella parasuis]MCT8771242.1 long-chain fatty acid--CoA ligase [Glaesserella parasuis]MCT8777752.1 long-chain fatty acid--CoA ligase [Glaesserella parasuis]